MNKKIKRPPIIQNKHLYKSASTEVLAEAQRCADDLYKRSKVLEEAYFRSLKLEFSEDEYFWAARRVREHKEVQDSLRHLFNNHFKCNTPIENYMRHVDFEFCVDYIRSEFSFDVRDFYGVESMELFDKIEEGEIA